MKTTKNSYTKLSIGEFMVSRWDGLGLKKKLGLQLVFTIISGLLLLKNVIAFTFLDTLIVAGVLSFFSFLLISYALSSLDRLAKKATGIADNSLSQFVYTGRHDDLGKIEFALIMAESEANYIGDSAQPLNKPTSK